MMRSVRGDRNGGAIGSILLIFAGIVIAYLISAMYPYQWATFSHWMDQAKNDIIRWFGPTVDQLKEWFGKYVH